ncbi:MAG: thioredoxin family protein [Planctomycetales bacterium]|nr:thioredoxin family protein [Planctomycetales bacterium]
MLSASLASRRQVAFAFCLLVGFGSNAVLAQFEFPQGIGAFSKGNSAAEVTVQAQFTPADQDRPAILFVTAMIADGFHISAVDQAEGGPLPTAILLAPDSPVQVVGAWRSVEPPETHIDKDIWVGLELREHTKQVTWFAPIELPSGTDPAALKIAGRVEGQACAQVCIPFDQEFTARQGKGVSLPPGIDFTAPATAEISSDATTNPNIALDSSQAKDESTAGPTRMYDLSLVSLQETEGQSLTYYLLTAFLGGVILNVMPCVLPVIGLKVMSFVQQAGQSRAHALALNCWYSAGIVAVFLVLASLAVTLQLGWGGQFSNATFNIALIAIVFAMALSLLGLWDIPIPGFVGSSTAVEITEREGPTAAFLKGVLTTLLATPCIGPFMATALAWAVKQPAWMTYSVFTAVGIGMASPYLLIGAFPNLIRFLPRPGAWMETFKKLMGLILLATVVWLLTFIEAPLVVPTVALMVVIVGACWWITQTRITALFVEKVQSWIIAGLIVAIGAMGSYGWLYKKVMLPRHEKSVAARAEQEVGEQRLRIARDLGRIQNNELLRQTIAELAVEPSHEEGQNWQRFSLEKLGHLVVDEGRTVLVDFTADWCLTCKTLEKLVLKTQPIEEALTLADVVTMEADYTKKPEVIDRTIKALGGIGVPLIAIFPGSDPYHPIVFAEGKYTKAELLEAIAQATGRGELLKTADQLEQSPALSQAGGEPRL